MKHKICGLYTIFCIFILHIYKNFSTGFEDEARPIVDTVDNSKLIEGVKDAKNSSASNDFNELFNIFNGGFVFNGFTT